MRSLLFEKQDVFGSVPWTDLAAQVGMPDVTQFAACVNDTRPMERVEQGKKLADVMDVRGTPTVIINGWKLPQAPSLNGFDKIVQYVVDGGMLTAEVASARS